LRKVHAPASMTAPTLRLRKVVFSRVSGLEISTVVMGDAGWRKTRCFAED